VIRLTTALLLLLTACAVAQTTRPTAPSTRMTSSKVSVRTAAWNADAWVASDEGKRVADNLLSWQYPSGGWPKNYDASTPKPANAGEGDDHGAWEGTFDNGGTYSELRLLARAYTAHKKPEYRDAFGRGLKFLLKAQFPSGGWPQRYPLGDNYGRHITYNDGAMVGVMRLLEAIIKSQPGFAFAHDDAETLAAAQRAFDKGIDCILATQIRVNGTLTGWCQQHDEVTLAPAAARTFEPPAIATNESAGVVMLLMTQPQLDADPRVRASVEAAMKWFDAVKVTGFRYDEVSGPQYENGKDRLIVPDANAAPIWARLYDIETNRPLFCGRDGVVKYELAQIDHERRTGYAWYGKWPARAMPVYEEWKKRVNAAAPQTK
jgi:PelA/Pel-15E family pectate lyase